MNTEIAFWKYDQFPYLLSGTITKREIKYGIEMVETKEFGRGFWFEAYFVLPQKEGKELKSRLDVITHDHQEELEAAHEKAMAKRELVLKEYGLENKV